MSRRRGRPRKRDGAGVPAGVQHYTWLKPIKSRPPEPFFDSGPALAKRCPETALLCAILEDAFVCFYEARDPRVAEEAQRWFFADGGPTMFSFVSICEALGLDAREVRQRLAGGLTVAADSAESNGKTPRRRSSPAPEIRKPQR